MTGKLGLLVETDGLFSPVGGSIKKTDDPKELYRNTTSAFLETVPALVEDGKTVSSANVRELEFGDP
jgi:hypothetical protein